MDNVNFLYKYEALKAFKERCEDVNKNKTTIKPCYAKINFEDGTSKIFCVQTRRSTKCIFQSVGALKRSLRAFLYIDENAKKELIENLIKYGYIDIIYL